MILLELMLTDWNCSERLVTVIIPVAVSVCDSSRLHEFRFSLSFFDTFFQPCLPLLPHSSSLFAHLILLDFVYLMMCQELQFIKFGLRGVLHSLSLLPLWRSVLQQTSEFSSVD